MNVLKRKAIDISTAPSGTLIYYPPSASAAPATRSRNPLILVAGLFGGLLIFGGFQMGMYAQYQRTATAEARAATAEAKLEAIRQCINSIK